MGARAPALLGLSLAAAALLRALRVPARWDEISLAYAAYTEPVVHALRNADLAGALGNWVGLHPPLHATLHGLSELLLPIPLLWLAGSAIASLLAVVLVGRTGGWVAALVLATAPLQLADAAEVNNYALSVLGIAALLAASRARWPWLVAAVFLAAWAHLLGLVAAVGVVAWRLWRPWQPAERGALAAAAGLACLPVIVGALALALSGGTYGQPSVDLWAWVELVAAAVGPEGWVLGVLALWTLRDEALVVWCAVALAVVASILLGAAAAHQRPYYALLGPPIAVALARNPRRSVQGVVVALCVLRGVRAGAGEVDVLAQLFADQKQQRAVDVALDSSQPGDTLWLVAPALQPDDDKTATSPVLWRIRPWHSMPMARPVAFEYTDYRYGQPRMWNSRIVHSSTELDEAAFDHVVGEALGRDHLVWVVVYEHAPATGLIDRLERVLRPYAWTVEEVGGSMELGADRLYRVSAVLGKGS